MWGDMGGCGGVWGVYVGLHYINILLPVLNKRNVVCRI